MNEKSSMLAPPPLPPDGPTWNSAGCSRVNEGVRVLQVVDEPRLEWQAVRVDRERAPLKVGGLPVQPQAGGGPRLADEQGAVAVQALGPAVQRACAAEPVARPERVRRL